MFYNLYIGIWGLSNTKKIIELDPHGKELSQNINKKKRVQRMRTSSFFWTIKNTAGMIAQSHSGTYIIYVTSYFWSRCQKNITCQTKLYSHGVLFEFEWPVWPIKNVSAHWLVQNSEVALRLWQLRCDLIMLTMSIASSYNYCLLQYVILLIINKTAPSLQGRLVDPLLPSKTKKLNNLSLTHPCNVAGTL